MAEKKTEKNAYIYAVGRRKTASAQVRLMKGGKGVITVNEKKLEEYLPVKELQEAVKSPLTKFDMDKNTDVSVIVSGGGMRGQAEAIRLGIARAMLKDDEDMKKTLKVEGYLTRDARVKERKKPGLRRARRSPQWSKR